MALAVLATGVAATAQEDAPAIVAEVVVEGGITITAETVEYYLGISEGEPWDPATVRGTFHRFWESGLVDDARVEVEAIEPGRVRVVVTVVERPKVSEYTFEGNKKLSNGTLRENLETAGISLRRNGPLQVSEVQRMRQTIQESYAKEGYAAAVVTTRIDDVGPNLREVTFVIDEGAKIKIGEIGFEGNEVYSDRRLRLALKKVKEKRFFRPWGKKLIWSKESWGEDSENLKKFYMNRGYKDIVVGEPKVELVAGNPEAATQKEKKFRMSVTIPVEEGERYRLGDLEITGNTVFDDERLLKAFEVEPGRHYNHARIEEANEAIRELYQSRGYIYAYTNQRLVDDPEQEKVVDVTVDIYEGDRFRLGRLEFAGNSKTQEKVLRREFRINEGEWMNMAVFRRSVFKVNQLGYFKLTEDPLEFDFDDEEKLVNVIIKGQEVGRTDIQFGAGYSELYDFFFQFMFNTRNFLGRGETLGVAVSSGGQADTYSLSFSEPYFLDRRMVIGGSVYRQTYDILDFERDAKGGSVFWGLGIGDFGQFTLHYGYEDVFARYVSSRQGRAGEEPRTPHDRPLPPPYTDFPTPTQFRAEYAGVTSSFTPAYFYDSRDDPFDPNSGLSVFGRLRYAGGVLGGDFNYFRPEVGFSVFHPLTRRYIAALNFEAGMIDPFDGSIIPIYDRYRLGGERSLRGLPYYSVLPREENGDYFTDANGSRLGGDRYMQVNLEYQIKLGGPLKFILFSDIGNTWHEDQGWDFGLLRYTAGAELRIFLPIFQAPLRFIYGYNLDPFEDEKKSDFQFSIGTTF